MTAPSPTCIQNSQTAALQETKERLSEYRYGLYCMRRQETPMHYVELTPSLTL